MTDIFQEVEEDVRREALMKLWRNYGLYAIGLAVAVVLGVGGWEAYGYFSNQQAEKNARAFLAASDSSHTDPKAAEQAFSEIAKKGGGYGTLAKFRLAQIKSDTGDRAGAIAIYDQITASTKESDLLHGLAILKSGYAMLDGASQSGLEQRLAPIVGGDNPWHHAALELLAFGALKAGDKTTARERFAALAADKTTPEGMISRARDMAASLADTLPAAEPAPAPKEDAPAPAASPAVPTP